MLLHYALQLFDTENVYPNSLFQMYSKYLLSKQGAIVLLKMKDIYIHTWSVCPDTDTHTCTHKFKESYISYSGNHLHSPISSEVTIQHLYVVGFFKV